MASIRDTAAGFAAGLIIAGGASIARSADTNSQLRALAPDVYLVTATLQVVDDDDVTAHLHYQAKPTPDAEASGMHPPSWDETAACPMDIMAVVNKECALRDNTQRPAAYSDAGFVASTLVAADDGKGHITFSSKPLAPPSK